jgi:expansin (peptidoglycan-binding protein)
VVSGGDPPGPDDGGGGEVDGGEVDVDGGGPPCDPEPMHDGEATYYDADGSGNCSFDPIPGDFLVAAANDADYDGAAACGACAEVEGPDGSVVVRIVDRCPGCGAGDLDLSQTAFGMIASLSAGRVAIAWRYVACDVAGPIRYHFQGDSSLQLRNHRYGIARLEARTPGGTWTEADRALHNYFGGGGLGSDPVDLRVTDRHGHVLEDLGIAAGGDADGGGQFPACP